MLTKRDLAKRFDMTVRGIEKRIARGEIPKPDVRQKRKGRGGQPLKGWSNWSFIYEMELKKTHKGRQNKYVFVFNNMIKQ
jgi:hypothetical protein